MSDSEVSDNGVTDSIVSDSGVIVIWAVSF